MAMTYQTEFEPVTAEFKGSFEAEVLDPQGKISSRIIHTHDPWQIKCKVVCQGDLVPLLCGTMILEAKLESIGNPPVELTIAHLAVDLSSGTYDPATKTRTYDVTINVSSHKVPAGDYDLSVGFTTVGPEPHKFPGALAAFQHGPALKFIEF